MMPMLFSMKHRIRPLPQIDLNGKQESGLIQAVRILKDVKEIGFVELTSDDVVRHPLVQKIIECYEKAGRGQTKTDK